MGKETEVKVNEYQEALDEVKNIQGYMGFGEPEDAYDIFDEGDERIKLLQELVDKATPKKPIKRVLKRFEGDRCIVDVCPICDSELYYGQSCSNNKCRQAIDWSKDE